MVVADGPVLRGRLGQGRLVPPVVLMGAQTRSHCYSTIPASLPTLMHDVCANSSAISAASDVVAEEGGVSVMDEVCILEAVEGSRSLLWDRVGFLGTCTAAGTDWVARRFDVCRQTG